MLTLKNRALSPAPPPFDQSWLGVHKVGKYPIYAINLSIVDNEKANYLIQHSPTPMPIEQQQTIAITNAPVGNLGNEYVSVGGYQVAPSETHNFDISIYSFHSFPWSEHFSMRKIRGKWKTALLIDVSGTHPRTRAYYRIEDGFPLRPDGSPDNGWWWPNLKSKESWILKLPPHP